MSLSPNLRPRLRVRDLFLRVVHDSLMVLLGLVIIDSSEVIKLVFIGSWSLSMMRSIAHIKRCCSSSFSSWFPKHCTSLISLLFSSHVWSLPQLYIFSIVDVRFSIALFIFFLQACLFMFTGTFVCMPSGLIRVTMSCFTSLLSVCFFFVSLGAL